MNLEQLSKVARNMVVPGKGILAADESSGTIQKRFDAIKVTNTEENRRDYRELLFRSTEAMKTHVSGVILFDETIRQKAKDGTPLVKLIEDAGAIPGIKVDTGAKPLPFCPGETVTEGLDGLAGRLKGYHAAGRAFCEMACRHRHRRAQAELHLHPGERPCARPLRRAVPGGRHRADRRAGGADGRRP